MKIKTSELTGAALDWAVARCEGESQDVLENFTWRTADEFDYSTDWSKGGPIIERQALAPCPEARGLWYCKGRYQSDPYNPIVFDGPTPLIAAMRCYVASKLGGEVDVPDELVNAG